MSILSKFKNKFENIRGRKEKSAPDVSNEKSKPIKLAKEDKAEVRVSKKEKTDSKKTKIEIKDKSGLASRVIVRPLQTEKVTDQMIYGQYSFEVALNANKVEIKKAIRAIYEVEPVSVNVINVMGKPTRFVRVTSKRKNWRKAVVTLKPGDKIEVYEGV